MTSTPINVDTFRECAGERREFQSFGDARQEFDQMCDFFQHSGHYRMKIAWENAEQLQNACDQPNSQLNGTVLDFIKCMIDHYMPLGIPHEEQIQMASQKLIEIRRKIGYGSYNLFDIIQLSNAYYQMIPHSSGRNQHQQCIQFISPNYLYDNRKNCRPLLNTNELWMGKIAYIERLSSLEKAFRQGIKAENMNPLDYIYNNYLRINLMPIPNRSIEYRQFLSQFGLMRIASRIKRVFNVQKTEWMENFVWDIGNHHYLFHSTHLANVVNILKDGLQIAPAHVFSYNRWAGKGIYFHGSVDAANSYASRLNHNVILVCRVALGCVHTIHRCMFIEDPDYVFPLGPGEHSLRQLGRNWSLFEFNHAYNAWLPAATQMEHWGPWSKWEQYDEFLVQSAYQVNIEFILELF